MPRRGLNPDRVVEEAMALANEVGLEALTLAAVAQRLGVSGPALYKHVDGLDALRRDIAVRALRELTAALTAATIGRAGEDALRGLATAYRAFARTHLGVIGATLRAPADGDQEHIDAANQALGVLAAVLRGYQIDDAHQIDALRTIRAVLHGFASVEAAGGFGLPDDLDTSYERYIDTLDAGLRSWS